MDKDQRQPAATAAAAAVSPRGATGQQQVIRSFLPEQHLNQSKQPTPPTLGGLFCYRFLLFFWMLLQLIELDSSVKA